MKQFLAKRSRQSRREGKAIQAIERNSSGGLIRMTPLQRKRANALIHRLCCNYCDGMCIALDYECVQCNSYSVMCKWFRAAALPQDKALFAEVIKPRESKRCVICGKAFVPKSNRGQYCGDCARTERKRKKAEYERNRRKTMDI